jgi:hypothetical protein
VITLNLYEELVAANVDEAAQPNLRVVDDTG